ncbi:MAG: PadR family transcriptional regulator [Lapillicoccus sp.]
MTATGTTPTWPADWLRGVLELCVLGVLAEGPTYGYAIAHSLAEAGLGVVKGGTLYPLLTRLETEELVEATWRAGEGGPGRKFFELTDGGRAELARRDVLWAEFVTRTQRLLPAGRASGQGPTPNLWET